MYSSNLKRELLFYSKKIVKLCVICASFGNLMVLNGTDKADWTIHLIVKLKDSFGIVYSNWSIMSIFSIP